MTEETNDKPDIMGKPVSEISYDDLKPYIGYWVAYKGGFEEGRIIATEIVAVGETIDDCCKATNEKSGSIGWIMLLEEGDWRNYDFLIGRK